MTPPNGARSDRVATGVLLGAVTLLALALRLPGLNGDLWLDELATVVSFVRLPLWDIVSNYESPNNHVLGSALAHLSIGAFGESSWAVRLPAMLFAVATVPALYFLARAYAPRGVAMGAAVVLAASYHHVYFSQNARGYTGLLFFSVLSTGLLARALATGRGAYWFGFACAAALNIYALLSGLFVAVGQFLGLMVVHVLPGGGLAEVRRRFGRVVGWMSVAAGLTLLLHAPLLRSMFMFYTTAEDDVGWTPSANLLLILLRDAITIDNRAVVLAGAVLLVPVVTAGCVRLARRAPLVFFALLLPPIIEASVVAAMGVGTYPRRFLLLLPFGILVAVFGSHALAEWIAARVRRPAWASRLFAAAIVVGVVAAASGLPRLYRLPKQDYRGAIRYVEAHRQPGDIVAGAYMAVLGLEYYGMDVRSARSADSLALILAEGRPVWLVGTLLDDMRLRAPDLDALVRERFEEQTRLPGLMGDGDMVVWRTRAP